MAQNNPKTGRLLLIVMLGGASLPALANEQIPQTPAEPGTQAAARTTLDLRQPTVAESQHPETESPAAKSLWRTQPRPAEKLKQWLDIENFTIVSALSLDTSVFDNVVWKSSLIANTGNGWSTRLTFSQDLTSYPVEELEDDLRITSFRIGVGKSYSIRESVAAGVFFEAGSATINFFGLPEPDSPEVSGGMHLDWKPGGRSRLFVRFEYERVWSVAPFVDEYIRNIFSAGVGLHL